MNEPFRSTNHSDTGSAGDSGDHTALNIAADERARLLDMFRTSAADLAANRAGCLGGAQIQRLRGAALRTLAGAVAGDVILVVIMLAVASRPLKPVQSTIAVLLGGALLVLGVVGFQRMSRAAAEGVVSRLTGEARISDRGRAGTFLVIGAREFRVPRRSYNLRGGTTYAAYFTPAGNAVVALEPVTD